MDTEICQCLARDSLVIAAHRCEPGNLSHHSPPNHIFPNLKLDFQDFLEMHLTLTDRHQEDLNFAFIL